MTMFKTTAYLRDGGRETRFIPAPNWGDAMAAAGWGREDVARVSAMPLRDGWQPRVIASNQAAPEHRAEPLDVPTQPAEWLDTPTLAELLPDRNSPWLSVAHLQAIGRFALVLLAVLGLHRLIGWVCAPLGL